MLLYACFTCPSVVLADILSSSTTRNQCPRRFRNTIAKSLNTNFCYKYNIVEYTLQMNETDHRQTNIRYTYLYIVFYFKCYNYLNLWSLFQILAKTSRISVQLPLVMKCIFRWKSPNNQRTVCPHYDRSSQLHRNLWNKQEFQLSWEH